MKIGGGIIDCLSIHLPSKYVYGPVMQACISLVQTTLPDGSVQLLDPSTNLECSHAWRAALHAVRVSIDAVIIRNFVRKERAADGVTDLNRISYTFMKQRVVGSRGIINENR